MSFGKTFWACLLAVIVASCVGFIFSIIEIFSIIGILSSSILPSDQLTTIKSNSVLKISLRQPISENSNVNPFSMVDFRSLKINRTLDITSVVNAIDEATHDPRISGIVIDVGNGLPVISVDHVYQIRSALEKFHNDSQKFVVCQGDQYSLSDYWLGTISDLISVNPSGLLEWIGVSGSMMFYKDALDKLGIEAQIFRAGKYKSAVEPFMSSEMSEENRAQNSQLLSTIWNNILTDVSASRKIDVEVLNKYADNLDIVTPKDALSKGMVDTLLYKSDFMDYLANLLGVESPKEVSMVNVGDYARSIVPYGNYNESKIAILFAEGDMVDDGSNPQSCIVGQNLANQIDKLRADSTVKAVVLRINSPGGSVMAAATIHNSMKRLKEVKPVVVSMGAYAASGGYYVSAPADAIVASPFTITGSIGAFGLVFNVQKTLKQFLGVNVQSISTNKNSSISMLEPLTDAQKLYMQKSIDRIYKEFLELVATGRNMPVEKVDEIAQGRVWSGIDAKQIGLVDEIGTIQDAIDLASVKAGIEDYGISIYPKEEESFFSLFASSIYSKIRSSFGSFDIQEDVIEQLKAKEGFQVLMPYKININ